MGSAGTTTLMGLAPSDPGAGSRGAPGSCAFGRFPTTRGFHRYAAVSTSPESKPTNTLKRTARTINASLPTVQDDIRRPGSEEAPIRSRTRTPVLSLRTHGVVRPGAAQPRVSALDDRVRELLDELDERDGYVSGHGPEVSRLAVAIGRALGLPEEELELLAAGALLHDLGKLFVDRRILAKPTPLSSTEWKTIRLHPALGVALLGSDAVSEPVLAIVRSHHERWDGDGYPHRLAGVAIPHGARIVATADAFCAMRESRPYRPPRTLSDALAELERTSWRQFDGACVRALVEAIDVG